MMTLEQNSQSWLMSYSHIMTMCYTMGAKLENSGTLGIVILGLQCKKNIYIVTRLKGNPIQAINMLYNCVNT
jgi:hypothetical protein